MDVNFYKRNGEWLELSMESLNRSAKAENNGVPSLQAGSHPHHVRQWLLALALFPEKWVNRLFSTGGIRLESDTILLRAFVPVDPEADTMYRLVKQSGTALGREQVPVLFEDDWCLVLDKPSGMPVHPSAPGQRGTLDEAAVRRCVSKNDPLPVKHIHRLDDDTAGPVLYAKNELAQLRLDEAMRDKRIERQYLALVQGRMKLKSGIIDEAIGKDRHHSARRRVSPSGDSAVTHYELIETYKQASLVRLRLETGRTHQIRVHMSHIGYPLVGDVLYGGSGSLLPHQALRGERLTFEHPFTGEPIAVLSPEPAWFRDMRIRLDAL